MMNLENKYSKFLIPILNSKFNILNSKIAFQFYICLI
jgi:hypothetical protein